MTKRIIFSAAVLLALASCNKHNVTITGSIKDAGKQKVYLEQINVGNSVAVDSTETNKAGEFRFKTFVEQPTFFNVKVGAKESITFIASADEHIQLSGSFQNLSENYWIDGSENSLWIKLLNFQLHNTVTLMDSLQRTFAALPQDAAHQAAREEVAHAWDSIVNKQICKTQYL